MTINDWLGWVTVIWAQLGLDRAMQTIAVIIIAFLAWKWFRGGLTDVPPHMVHVWVLYAGFAAGDVWIPVASVDSHADGTLH